MNYDTLADLLKKYGIEEVDDDYKGGFEEIRLENYGIEELYIANPDDSDVFLLNRSKAKFLIDFILHYGGDMPIKLVMWESDSDGKDDFMPIEAMKIYIID